MQLSGYRPLEVNNPFGGPILLTPETDSTMEDARSLVAGQSAAGVGMRPGDGAPPADGLQAGAVLVAEYQRAGRGQGPNRSWTAPPGSSLMFTLCLPDSWVPAPREALPLRMALGLAAFLEGRGVSRVGVKWPNDVLVAGGKVCGILCHHIPSWFLVGVGLNVNQGSFPEALRAPATSLALATAAEKPLDPLKLLPALLAELRGSLDDGAWRQKVDARLSAAGSAVRILLPGAPEAPDFWCPGTVVGIRESGALAVRRLDTGEIEEIYSRDRVEWPKKI